MIYFVCNGGGHIMKVKVGLLGMLKGGNGESEMVGWT